MPKHKTHRPPATKKFVTWSLTEYEAVIGHLENERFALIDLESFYSPAADTEADITMLLWNCQREGLDTKLVFGELVDLVKSHFNLGTVWYMHRFEAFA